MSALFNGWRHARTADLHVLAIGTDNCTALDAKTDNDTTDIVILITISVITAVLGGEVVFWYCLLYP